MKSPSFSQPLKFQIDHMPVPIGIIDINGFILELNPRFCSIFGFKNCESIRNTSILDLVTPDSKKKMDQMVMPDSTIRRTNEASADLESELWLKKANGQVFPARISLKRLDDAVFGAGKKIIVVHDETDYHIALKKIEHEGERLQKNEQLRNEFVAIASHELRTPIQPILGFAFLASQGLMPQDKAWEGVLSEAMRLQQLANDILDVSRLDSGTLRYEFAKIRISDIIINSVESLKTDLKNDIAISTCLEEGTEELEIEADKSRISQVIANVVGNAIKFTEKGKVMIHTRTFKDQNRFQIRISDTGKGIPEEIMPRLYEKFMTKNHSNSTKQGTGLGLYITKAIIDAHNGKIIAKNNSGGGATFIIELPISRGSEMITGTEV